MKTFVISVTIWFAFITLIKVLCLGFAKENADRGYNAVDVLINLPFLVWGIITLVRF